MLPHGLPRLAGRRPAVVAGETSHRDQPHPGGSAHARRIDATRGVAVHTLVRPITARSVPVRGMRRYRAARFLVQDRRGAAGLPGAGSQPFYQAPRASRPRRFEFLPGARQVDLRFSERCLTRCGNGAGIEESPFIATSAPRWSMRSTTATETSSTTTSFLRDGLRNSARFQKRVTTSDDLNLGPRKAEGTRAGGGGLLRSKRIASVFVTHQ